MSIQFTTGLGLDITLPDGAEPIAKPSAGPLSAQFSLSNGDVVSVVRDDSATTSLAGIIAWTQAMASHYVTEFGAVEEMQGSITAEDGQGYAYTVSFNDADSVPRRATFVGRLLAGGIFAGITLLTIDDGTALGTNLVEDVVRGIAPTQP